MSKTIEQIEKTHELITAELEALYGVLYPGQPGVAADKANAWRQLLSLHITQLKGDDVLSRAINTITNSAVEVAEVEEVSPTVECEWCDGKGYTALQLTIEHAEDKVWCTVCKGEGRVPE